MTRVLFVDNFDSFTYNLVEYVSQHPDTETEVVRNTAGIEDVRAADPDAVVVSPGPGHPENERDVGVSTDVFRTIATDIPTLGVCLGLEAAVHAYGGEVGHAPEPIHGKAFPIEHDGRGVFRGLDQGFRGGRYHSLIATEVPDSFEVTATTESGAEVEDGEGSVETESAGEASDADAESGGDDGTASGPDGATELVMGVRHREYPIECVQFHPESVLTGVGHDVIENFLHQAEHGDGNAELAE